MDELVGSRCGPAGPAHLNLFAQDALLSAQDGVVAGDGLALVIVVALVVVILSFLASMTEAAFLSLPRLKATTMRDSESRIDRMAGKMRLAFGRPLATIVIINNLANVTGSALFGLTVARWLGNGENADVDAGVWIGSTILTFVVIVAGEIIPKTIGERYSPTVTRIMAPVIRALTMVLFPVVYLVGLAQKPFMRVSMRHVTSEEEIARLTELGREQGAIEPDEGEMIRRVFRLNDIKAEDIMTPRVEIVSLPADKTLGEIAAQLGEITRSRIPLYGDDGDDVLAMLDRSDALHQLALDRMDVPVTDASVSFKPFFVPETIAADDLMVTLQRRTNPIAIVVGEYGDTVGVVTLEDVIEEIVGEIVDEGDLANAEDLERVGDDEIVCDARTEVNAINDALGTSIPNHRTVAGLLLDELERIPAKGAELLLREVRIRVEDANDRAILSVRVTKLVPEEDDDEQ